MSWVPLLIRSSWARGRRRDEGEKKYLPRELLFWIRYTTVICLTERKNWWLHDSITAAAAAETSGVNELQTFERSPESSTSFLLLLFKSSFPIQPLIFPVRRRAEQKPPWKGRQWICVERQDTTLRLGCYSEAGTQKSGMEGNSVRIEWRLLALWVSKQRSVFTSLH
jgi:hypothetical protein